MNRSDPWSPMGMNRMKHVMKTELKFERAVLLAAVIGWSAGAQDFGIDWFALAGGGGSSQGPDFELTATVGQPEAGEIASGDFAIVGGFWGIVTVEETPGQPALSVSFDGATVMISWPESGSEEFTLQETAALGTSWVPVSENPQASNGIKTVRVPLAPGNHFYRLQKP